MNHQFQWISGNQNQNIFLMPAAEWNFKKLHLFDADTSCWIKVFCHSQLKLLFSMALFVARENTLEDHIFRNCRRNFLLLKTKV